jgi:hypothetical protein
MEYFDETVEKIVDPVDTALPGRVPEPIESGNARSPTSIMAFRA